MAPDEGLRATDWPDAWQPRYLDVIGIIFVTCLLVSNLAAVKLFNIGPATFTAGILVFPISYIFGDVLTEVYGYARTRRIIWAGLVANLFMAAVLWVAIQLPPSPGWPLQEAFAQVHRLVPRIVIASLLAYWAGEFTNSVVLSKMKVWSRGRHLWLRTIGSTIVGQLVDTAVFVLIGFLGVFPAPLLVGAIISGWLFKVVYEAVATPGTYWVIGYLKRLEGVDHFDVRVNYNPFKLWVRDRSSEPGTGAP